MIQPYLGHCCHLLLIVGHLARLQIQKEGQVHHAQDVPSEPGQEYILEVAQA
jgi:hypothetical protein